MKNFVTRIAIVALAMIATTGFLRAQEDGWMNNYAKASAKSKAEGKLLLLDFTGSDWCIWCMRLQREIFSQPKFKEYAAKKLVLMEVDFPMNKEQPDDLKKQNADLQEKYHIEGFPTIVVLSPSGKKVGELGYVQGGPDAFIAELDKIPKS